MTVTVPCEGAVTNPFQTILYDDDGNPIYNNAWKFHLGIDIGAEAGTPVVCANNGVVEYVGHDTLLGNTVILWHKDRSRSLYAHLSEMNCTEGQRLKTGDSLGRVGATGKLAFGAHLHFEIWVNCRGAGMNPYELTRDDPAALPADPATLWRNQWPTAEEGVHTPGWQED